MPVTKVGSRWSSGDLIFYEKDVSLGAVADILTIGDDAVTVGSTTNDIDFKWYGTGSVSFILDVSDSSMTLTGCNVAIDGDVVLDTGDLTLGDTDYLRFGDATNGDVRIHWDGALYVTPDASNTMLSLGVAGKGLDVRFLTNSTGYYVDWDASANWLEFDTGTHIHLLDRSRIYFGTGSDVNVYWDGALYFTPAAANTVLALGAGGMGLDVRFFTNTGGYYAEWDASANHLEFMQGTSIHMADSARIYFGTGSDMNLFFDGTTLYFACATQNIGFNLGDGGSGLALKLESNTGGHYVQWTPSTNMLDFIGATGIACDGTVFLTGAGNLIVGGTTTLNSTLTVGSSGTGHDVTLNADTANYRVLFDAEGDSSKGSLEIGQNIYGIDFSLYGQTTGEYVTWDASAGTLDIASTITAAGVIETITVTDSGTQNTGRGIGLFIDYVASDDKTGSYGVRSSRINTQILGDCPSVQVADWYLHTIVDKTITHLDGLAMYWEDFGSGIGNACMINLGMNSDHTTVERHCFIKCREHTTVQANSGILQLEGDNAARYLVIFESNAPAMDTGEILEQNSDTEASDMRVTVRTTVGDRYIYLYPV